MLYKDLTLDEAAKVDLDQTYEVIAGAKRYAFADARKAISFVGACVKTVLHSLGIEDPAILNPADPIVERMQRERGVHVERRKHYDSSGDVWRNGFYIYKDDELIAFIGEPLQSVPHPLLPFQKDAGMLFVVTNVDPEQRRRVYG